MSRRWFIGALAAAALFQGLPVMPAQAADPVLIGAGDIATCSGSNDSKTADLVANQGGTVFTIGDNAYNKGTASEFANCFGPTWGKFKNRIHPAVGDNEYLTSGAKGYFDYFGSAAGKRGQGWYSYNVGAWHIVVLNSNCSKVGGCGKGSAQEKWLKADLAASNSPCIAAVWHSPRFSSVYGNSSATKPFWDDLYAAGADIVLNGHHHAYERFAPQDPSGHASSHGIREFLVGTGGAPLAGSFKTVQPNSQVRNNKTYGVLKLTLHSNGYDFAFQPASGSSFRDSGSGSCNDKGGGTVNSDTTSPPAADAVSVAAEADSSVASAEPSATNGAGTILTADTSPLTSSYLRFAVGGVGPVDKATLRLFVKDKTGNGPEVYPTDPNWSEDGLTWASRPARTGPLLDDVGSLSAGQWVDYDVSARVTGDGTWSFELAGDSTDGADFSSRDAASNPPQLVLVPQATPPPSPDPAPASESLPTV